MKMLKVITLAGALVLSSHASAEKLAGVEVADSVQIGDTRLVLNGAGIRSKFVFDIYVISLYLPQASDDAQALLASPPQNRVSMHFVYDKVEKDKLDEAWAEGFEDNLSSDQLKALESRLSAFSDMFGDAVENDVVNLDYDPASGTKVTINGVDKGTVEGADFNSALLSIWIGNDPITRKLKTNLLGG
ncbi:MAG: chalcone isomerase family protein [Pseudomonadota bacterium]